MSDSAAIERPACADECMAVIREKWEVACREHGVPVIEAVVSYLPPLVESGYEPLECVCPHGVLWHMEPTSDQITEWVEEGVE